MHNKTVLVVEDNLINQHVIGDMLESFGFQPFIAGSGEQALKIFDRQEIALVLMDVRLPGLNGLETTQAIRQLEAGESVPVIALTADAMTGAEQQCRRAGMSDFLAKPIDPNELQSRLNFWCARNSCEV